MVVYLNPCARQGTAQARFERIAARIAARVQALGQNLEVEELTAPDALAGHLDRAIGRGQRWFAAAGGDGAVHALLNAMMRLPASVRGELRLGAIGLGSSNDFHKPLSRAALEDGVPVRLDGHRARPHNVCEAIYTLADGTRQTEHFVINASFGLLAEGNAFFNRGDPALRLLKRISVTGAIWYAAARSLFAFRPFRIALQVDLEKHGEEHALSVSNLSLCINPHFTGSLRYDTPVGPESEHIALNLIDGLSRTRSALAFLRIARGRFLGAPHTRSWNAREVEIGALEPVAFEMDGEVRKVTHVRVKLIREALRVCQA